MTQCALAAVLVFEYAGQPLYDWVAFCSYTSLIVYRDPTCICLYVWWAYGVDELSSALVQLNRKTTHSYTHECKCGLGLESESRRRYGREGRVYVYIGLTHTHKARIQRGGSVLVKLTSKASPESDPPPVGDYLHAHVRESEDRNLKKHLRGIYTSIRVQSSRLRAYM